MWRSVAAELALGERAALGAAPWSALFLR